MLLLVFAVCHLNLFEGAVHKSPSPLLLLDSTSSLLLPTFLLIDADHDALPDALLSKLVEKTVLPASVQLDVASLPSEQLLHLKEPLIGNYASV